MRRSSKGFLVYVGAWNDTNGNPRRGWIRYEIIGSHEHAGITKTDMVPRAFYDEEYSGWGAVPLKYRGLPQTGMISITPNEYRAWIKFEAEQVKEGKRP